MKKTIILLFILLTSTNILSCKEKTDTLKIKPEPPELVTGLKEKYPFLQLQGDSILNDSLLIPFFEMLHNLHDSNRVINIVHIGDSHIQADIATERVRILLQKAFGNAGRGLVFPHRIARSNEPENIRSAAIGEWRQVSIISKKRELEPGIGTRTVFTTDTTASFTLSVKNEYDFSKVRILAPQHESFFDFSLGNEFGEIFSSTQLMDNTFHFDTLSCSFCLKITPNTDMQSEFRLNGIVLQNNAASGILYHSMGTNGAHFADYNNSPEFFQQLPLLQPDLVIISLGTNEGAARDITKEVVYADALKMIESIKTASPGTPILLTTPVHNFYQKKTPNQRLKLVHEALLKVAADNRTAVLDLYEMGGGYGSCQKWKTGGLLRPDGVHFTVDGYRLQGELIYNAIINSYLKYAD